MSDKPSYLGLLNAISVAETDAFNYLNAWIETTPNPDVKAVLTTVCHREGEHGLAFAKRINELGYNVQPRDNPKLAEQMEIVRSSCSDLEKFEALGLGRQTDDGPDIFAGMFNDTTIDENILGMLTFILVPVQLLLIAFAMRGFQQAWNVEVERPAGGAAPQPA